MTKKKLDPKRFIWRKDDLKPAAKKGAVDRLKDKAPKPSQADTRG